MADAPRFNVLYVISDQHLATCTGYEGHAQAITPHMDRLAAEGARFRHAYAQNPICTPSRVSILSGQYCHNTGYFGLSGPTPGHGAQPPLPNLFEHFRTHGYRTAGIGKLHLPNDPVTWTRDALDLFADSYSVDAGDDREQTPYFEHLREQGLRDKEDSIALPEFQGQQQHEGRPSMLPYEHSVEGWCARQAMAFIDQRDDRPFFMQVSLPRPHQCYTPDQRFWDMYPDDLDLPPTLLQDASHRPPHFQRAVEGYRRAEGLIEPRGFEHVARRVWRAYLACITQVDFALGEMIEHLREAGQLDNTIVIYGSDHGAYSGTHGVPEKAPGICSEAVCRVPLLWRVPGVTEAGHESGRFVENVDIAPTLCSLCGLSAMETVDGKDITALLRGGDEPVRNVAVTEHPWSKAIRFDNWRLVHYQPEMFGGQDVGELYDIDADPNETRNLYHEASHAAVTERGRRLLLEWMIRTTRIRTMWPAPGDWRKHGYPTAGDGCESNTAGPAQRAAVGQLNYL